jgi:hypothetical protein
MGTPRHLNAQPNRRCRPGFKAYGVYRPEIVLVRAANPVCSLCPFLRRSASQPKPDASDFGKPRARSDGVRSESAVALRIYLAQRMSTAP